MPLSTIPLRPHRTMPLSNITLSNITLSNGTPIAGINNTGLLNGTPIAQIANTGIIDDQAAVTRDMGEGRDMCRHGTLTNAALA